MSFLEQEMRKIIENSQYKGKAVFLGETGYLNIGDYVRMRLEFTGDGRLHYDGLKMTIINYREGEVDSHSIRFVDVLGLKGTDNRIGCGGTPRIWNDEGTWEWYLYRPEQNDYKKMAKVIDNYAGLFQELETLQGPQLKL